MRFIGDDGLERGCEMKGFELSVIDFDLCKRDGREEASEILFIPDNTDGVKGVFASDRARCRDGVLGWLIILVAVKKERNADYMFFNSHVIAITYYHRHPLDS